jgi:hypothetical protein
MKINRNRSGNLIKTHNEQTFNGNSIMNDFIKNLDKLATQPRQENLFSQIQSIVNGTGSKFSSVEDKVKDMQERSGFAEYRRKVSEKEETTKVAQVEENSETNDNPEAIKKFPPLGIAINSYVDKIKGSDSIISVIEKMKSLYRSELPEDTDWNDVNLYEYINQAIIRAKHQYVTPGYTGFEANSDTVDDLHVDESNNDPFAILSPGNKNI